LNFQTLERIRLYVSGTRQKALAAAQNAQLNGYKQVALDHQNEVQMANLILKDLAAEPLIGEIYARQKADY